MLDHGAHDKCGQRLQKEARSEAERQVAEAKAAAEEHVNAAREVATREMAEIKRRAAEEVQTAENLAGEARVEAGRQVAEMTMTLEEAKTVAAAQVEEANAKAAAAKTRATEAEENGRQALRNAEDMVQAAKNAAATVQDGSKAELDRTNDKLEKRDTRVDELRNELDQVKDKLRDAEDRARTAETALRARKEQDGTKESARTAPAPGGAPLRWAVQGPGTAPPSVPGPSSVTMPAQPTGAGSRALDANGFPGAPGTSPSPTVDSGRLCATYLRPRALHAHRARGR
ncbi:hypothetical protein ABZT51_39365 [Streptomyces sp. NPDC005373]|uniref:hypothetical protein n=1 Tax=Streptomyces sp. NPDC005373 TaxID=3156879 RepID=UPI0033A8FB57